MQSKILNANIVCAGNPSHCKLLQVLIRFSVFAYLCWNSQHNGSKHYLFVDFAMLTHDYRECSRYSRSSVGTPELKVLNTFINALSVCRKPVDHLQSEF